MKLPALDPVDDYVQKIALEKDLAEFVRYAWPIVEPAKSFVGGWHIDLMCEYLMAVTAGQIKDLLILIPPRHMKSTLVCVFWPTWVWITDPAHRFITTSYSANLATRDSRRSRQVMESSWYREHFGDRFYFTSDQNVKNRYENDKTGFRLAAGVGGSLVGEGGDTLICDDPHNLIHIHSKLIRQSAITWWNEIMSTRRNDIKTSNRVVIMQRGHKADLAGDIIDKGGYKVLQLPAVAETTTTVSFPMTGKEIVRREGDLLSPERFDQTAIDGLKVDLGVYGSAAQLQQRPVPIGGGIFKGKWWQYYRELPVMLLIVQYWDTASKKEEQNDYSVCITMGKTATGYYVINLWRKKIEFPELKRRAVINYERDKPHKLMVEDKSSGQQLAQSLKFETILPIIPVLPVSDKVVRANAVSPTVEAGKVFLPERASWLADFQDEMETFPNAEYDDQVDAFDGALADLTGIGKKNKFGIPKLTRL